MFKFCILHSEFCISSVSPGLAVPAVVAHDRRLDQTMAFGPRVRIQAERQMARVVPVGSTLRLGRPARRVFSVTGDDRPDEAAQLLLVHDVTSTVSMMPTTAASTGASVRPRICPAARPSMTISTFS
jgi:hypothetical protein